MDREEIIRELEKITWWHSIDLGNGIVTPGKDNTPQRLSKYKLPDDLSGQTVLDIGAWDGFFSFEAERRGARRVLATDSYVWSGKSWGSKRGFEFARQVRHSQVEDLTIDVMNITPEKIGVFDLVLFLGVLYHVRHPLFALERVAAVTGKQLILETHVDFLWQKQPCLAFYPGSELDGDATNWWGPNISALEAMLKTVGFRQVQLIAQLVPLATRIRRAIYLKAKKKQLFFSNLQKGRAVVHAWK